MILLTGAAGKTGQAVLSGLNGKVKTRAFVRSEKQTDELRHYENVVFAYGDLEDAAALETALEGVDKVYFICPNLSEHELEIGQNLLRSAKKAGVKHFVYHSVLHPQVEKMPHHWQKLRTEESVFESGLDFTILQPCAYMQNILGGWKNIVENGVYSVPYANETRISIVDLMDVGMAAAHVLLTPGHENAIYELAGPQPLSQSEVAEALSQVLHKEIAAKPLDRSVWQASVRAAGMQEREIETLLKMFIYYENYDFLGNPNTLSQLIGKKPTSLVQYLTRHITSAGSH